MEELAGGQHVAHGDVYLTDEQTAGRGQGKNSWHASPGDNLTLSVVLQPDDLAVHQLFSLSQMASLAIVDCVSAFLPPQLLPSVSVKWPNDVYVDSKKIAGILVQNGLRGSSVKWSVVGIGLNVNESKFPGALSQTATSLHLLTSQNISLDEVREKLFDTLSRNYESLTHPGLNIRYQNLLYRKDRPAGYLRTQSGVTFQAILRNTLPDGRIQLEHPDGSWESFEMRSIKFV